jgi:hypothetical protein
MAFVLNVQKNNTYKGLIPPPPPSMRLCVDWDTMTKREDKANSETAMLKIAVIVLGGSTGVLFLAFAGIMWHLHNRHSSSYYKYETIQ